MKFSAVQPFWIAMNLILFCWNIKQLKFPSVKHIMYICGINYHKRQTKNQSRVRGIKIFFNFNFSGWKSFWLLDSNSTALVLSQNKLTALIKKLNIRITGINDVVDMFLVICDYIVNKPLISTESIFSDIQQHLELHSEHFAKYILFKRDILIGF